MSSSRSLSSNSTAADDRDGDRRGVGRSAFMSNLSPQTATRTVVA